MSDSVLVIMLLVLAAAVAAGIGGYLAAEQAGKRVVHVAEDIRSQVGDFLDKAEAKLERLEIQVPPVEVPQPVIHTSISPWSAFWLGLGFVVGMVVWHVLQAKHTRKMARSITRSLKRMMQEHRKQRKEHATRHGSER